MARCAAIKASGERCKAQAMTGYQQCYIHAPELAEKRKHTNRKGGRTGGRGRTGPGEVRKIQNQIRAVIGKVLDGSLNKGTGSVVFAGFHTLLRAVEVERRLVELSELEGRMAELESLLEQQEEQGGQYGGAS
jgi:hypothetical protein